MLVYQRVHVTIEINPFKVVGVYIIYQCDASYEGTYLPLQLSSSEVLEVRGTGMAASLRTGCFPLRIHGTGIFTYMNG